MDNSFAPGIGHRLDGWANRDLNVGAIIGLAPNLQPVANLLHIDEATVRKVLNAWGPASSTPSCSWTARPSSPAARSAATLIPPAFGLAGVNLHTWTGWGSVPYWNAFVAMLEMHGQGDFFDPRLDNAAQFPIAAENRFGHIRVKHDLVTPKLPGLQVYQLALTAPKPPKGSFSAGWPPRGKKLFNGQASARPATCRRSSPSPAGTCTPGSRSASTTSRPTARRRTCTAPRRWPACGPTPKGGFYHDGRFRTLLAVVKHYNSFFRLHLTKTQMNDLVQYLRSI